MGTPLQDRAGKNAALKPFAFANAAYGPHRSYVLDQTKGHQILIPGPPLPGSGSKNLPPRAQDTAGQFDLGFEKYMGARSRSIMTQARNLGVVFGQSVAPAGVVGDVVLVRPNGKAIVIGSIALTSADEANPALYTGEVGSYLCLAPGEDVVFIPNTVKFGSATGTGLFLPSFIDGDLIGHRSLLSTAKTTVMLVPPGKVWYTPPGVEDAQDSNFPQGTHRSMGILNLGAADVDFSAYINAGGGAADIRFINGATAPKGVFTPLDLDLNAPGEGETALFLPGGHSIKVALDTAEVDVFFCGVVMETNQAQIGDEDFAQATVVGLPGPL